MANITEISERLKNRLIYLKDDKTIVERITQSINELKYTKTGESLTKVDKDLIISNIESGLPLNEDASAEKLRELLKKIKDKINAK